MGKLKSLSARACWCGKFAEADYITYVSEVREKFSELSPQVATRTGRERGWLREGSIPLRFQGGVAAPLKKRSRSLAAQTGWLVKGREASFINIRVAHLILVGIY